MRRSFLVMLPAVFLFASMTFADDVVPATSDDVNQFDNQVTQSKERKRHQNRARVHKEKKANFGQAVSAETKALKEDGTKSKFGQTVSERAKKKGQVKGMKNCAGDAACIAEQKNQNKMMDQVRERKRVHSGSGQGNTSGSSGKQGANGSGGSGKGHGR